MLFAAGKPVRCFRSWLPFGAGVPCEVTVMGGAQGASSRQPIVNGGSIMPWTSVHDGLPNEGEECFLACMLPDGSVVEAIGYLLNGKWVIEAEDSEHRSWDVRRWMPFTPARRLA
jgi:hypothetical protein